MQRRFRLLVLVAAIPLITAACGGGDPSQPDAGPGETTAAADLRVGIAFDIGGLGDKSFNDSAMDGARAAIAEGLIREENLEHIEPNATGSNRDANVVNLADQGFDLVLAIGFAFSPGVAEIAGDYPETTFAVIDGYATCGQFCGVKEITTENVVDLTFKEHEGSFLVGVAAAEKSQTRVVGFLGGQRGTGLIEKFEAGFRAGVQEINPNIEVLAEYIGDDTTAFNDPTKGKALADKMYDDGADVIYHAAGDSGAGLFQSAVGQGEDALAIGVDKDQYLTASAQQKPHILTSMIKRVDTAVHDIIEETVNDEFEPGSRSFGLAEGGIDYAKTNPDQLTEDIVARIDEFKQQIIDGEITVPEKPEDV